MGKSPKAAGLGEIGEAKMLMIPFEFTGTDTLDRCDADGNPIDARYGQRPAARRRSPIPPAPAITTPFGRTTSTSTWYEDLMFGDGVGVVRTDLNGGAGVDLTGVSATNWYERAV